MSNKLRNRFLALGLFLAFVAVGMVFYVNWVVQKPFAIILFVTDNLTAPTLTAARIYQGGADHRLAMEGLPQVALLTTHANDFAVSDGASAATALATGQKVNNRAVGVDAGSRPLQTLLDIARLRGRSVGMVSNASLTDTTPAAFFAKTGDPHNAENIAAQLVDGNTIDVILGGGEAEFLPDFKEGRRTDGRDLMLEMRRKGFDVIRTKSELLNTPSWRAPKLFGVFASGNLAFADEIGSSGAQPSLAEMVGQAIQLLQYNRKGYLLVVDAALAGKAAHQNEGERAIKEILALDDAVATALAYAGESAAIAVVGRQSIGGMRLNGYPFRSDKGIAIVGSNAQGIPSLTWSTGPGSPENDTIAHTNEPSAVPAPAAVGVAEDTLAISRGDVLFSLTGFKDNTDVFRAIEKNL